MGLTHSIAPKPNLPQLNHLHPLLQHHRQRSGDSSASISRNPNHPQSLQNPNRTQMYQPFHLFS
ncbi:hypothetical protein Hanom_Chr05g00389441 [Helianthus anomalus]